MSTELSVAAIFVCTLFIIVGAFIMLNAHRKSLQTGLPMMAGGSLGLVVMGFVVGWSYVAAAFALTILGIFLIFMMATGG